MTSKLDLVKKWTDGPIDVEGGAIYLSDNFQYLDEDGNVLMDKQAYLGMGHMMVAAFPDLELVRTELREEGDHVILSGHWKGTFTNDFDLSAMGLGSFPANGEKIEWPDASNRVTVDGGKIVRMNPFGEGGSMEAFLAPLRK